MKRTNRHSLIVTAISTVVPMVALLGWTSHAQAQMRLGDDGHANDANNRIGSGGYNGGGNLSQRGAAVTNNQIIHGDTTGLNYFHGRIDTFDPNVINAPSNTANFDRFNAISGPVNVDNRVTGAPQSNNFVPFYTPNTVANTAIQNSLVTTPGGSGLIPAPKIVDQSSDTRLGLVNSLSSQSYLPAPGELDLPGPVDPSGKATVLTASPLFGVKAWNAADVNDAYFLSKYSNVRPEGPADRARLDNASIQQMRNELNSTIINPNGQPNDKGSDQNNAAGTNGNATNGTGNGNLSNSQRLGQPAEAPLNGAINTRPLNSNISTSAISSDLGTNQSVQQRLLVPPAQQSTQLAELERRRAQSKTKLTDQQATNAYNESVRAQAQKEDKAGNALNKNPAVPGNTANAPGLTGNGSGIVSKGTSNATVPREQAAPLNSVVKTPLVNPNEQPYVITSLATGIKAQGLAHLLKSAEEQMRQGKFTAALDNYDAAQQVAPNNPFVTLGRGYAELGASYYGKADADLRRSFLTEPALLSGIYDLKGFLGEDRLQFIQKDLKDIYGKEKSERPAFLLAYIAHNLGDDKQATTYLEEAKKRAGSDDAIVNLMRNEWGLQAEK